MTVDVTGIRIKSKNVGVYCEGVLVERFFNEAAAIIWLANLSMRGLKFPHEIKRCEKKEKTNKAHLLKFVKNDCFAKND